MEVRRLRFGHPITASPVVCDLDGDGRQEVLIAADRVHVLRPPNMLPAAGWPQAGRAPFASTPVVADTRSAGRVVFVGSDDDCLHGFTARGARLGGFPFQTGGDVFSTPLAGDLAGDGGLAVVFGSDDGNVHALRLDEYGALLSSHAQQIYAAGSFVSASPLWLGNDASGFSVAVGSWDGRMHWIRFGSEPGRVASADVGYLVWSSPVAGDLDGDGASSTVVLNDAVHVFDALGRARAGFPVSLGFFTPSTAAIADVDGDGRLEIVACADRIYLVRADGSVAPGFPVNTGAPFWASPLVVDVDGDDRQEIVACDYGGRLWAVRADGSIVEGYPIDLGSAVVSSPCAADVDGDGKLEILVGTWSGEVVILPTRGTRADWPQFRGPHGDGVQRASSRAFSAASVATVAGASFDRVRQRIAVAGKDGSRVIVREFAMCTTRGGPAAFPEVRLVVDGGDAFRRGTLFFSRGGAFDPSPFLGNSGRLVARLPRLRHFSTIDCYAELHGDEGRQIRIPERGHRRFRVWF